MWGEIEPFSATLAEDGLVECDQPRKHPLKYSAIAGNWTRATGRTHSEIHSFSHWAIITQAMERTDSEIHSLSHWAIMTRAMEGRQLDTFILPLSYRDWVGGITLCLHCQSISSGSNDHISFSLFHGGMIFPCISLWPLTFMGPLPGLDTHFSTNCGGSLSQSYPPLPLWSYSEVFIALIIMRSSYPQLYHCLVTWCQSSNLLNTVNHRGMSHTLATTTTRRSASHSVESGNTVAALEIISGG